MSFYKSAQIGGVSDFMGSFYAQGAVGGPGAITRATVSNINNAPMFQSLSDSAVIPTLPSTGIVPSEGYLAAAQIGGGSDFMHSFYSRGVSGGPGAITRATLDNINNAPMFNPLQETAVIPTLPSTGIVPSEAYLATATPATSTSTSTTATNMTGGGFRSSFAFGFTRGYNRQSSQPSDDKLRETCNRAGLSCRDMFGRYLSRSKIIQLLKSKNIRV